MAGSSAISPGTFGQPGVYGSLGTPADGNTPGSRVGASSWTDSSGNLWLFGGAGCDTSDNCSIFLNDLWEFDPSTNEWTWGGGSSIGGQPGVYGTLGTPAAGNIPGGRDGASSWIDLSGHIWLFGGQAVDVQGNAGSLNDLWVLNPSTNEWTWMGGSSTLGCTIHPDFCGAPGTYGTLGTLASRNVPEGRTDASGWTDRSGNLWLFGGNGVLADVYNDNGILVGGNSQVNDLWEYQLSPLLPATATPTFDVSLGTTTSAPTVSIFDATGGATMFYSTNGNTTTPIWNLYNGPFAVWGAATYQAVAMASGYSTSAVAATTVTAPKATPAVTISPNASSINTTQSLSVLVAVSGSGAPTATGSVTLTSGSYTSQATTLSGGSANIAVPAGSLATGNDTLTANYTGDSNYASATGTSSQVTVTLTPQTISFTQMPAETVGTQVTLSVGASSGLAVTLTSATPSVCTVSGLIVTFNAAGTCTIDANQAGNTTYSAAPQVQQSFTVNGEAQTITFGAIAAQTVGTPLTLSATASSGLAVTFTSTTTSVCAVSGTTATFIAAGNCTIDANQAGNSTYAAAPQVQQTFTVNGVPTFTGSSSAATIGVEPGATTANTATITVTPANGFTGTVNLTCAISPVAPSDPPACSLSPASVTINGTTAQTSTLTVTTTAATSSENEMRRLLWPSAGTALALFLCVPRSRRKWLTMLGVLVLLAAFVVTGCGGSGNSGGSGGTGNAGTTPGTYTVTITGTSGSITAVVGTVTLTVQ
jgi:hypothetical protein